jgi:choline kinase
MRKEKRLARAVEKGQKESSTSSRRDSEDSLSSTISLEDLQRILEANMIVSSPRHTPTVSPKLGPRKPSYTSKKLPSSRRMSRNASSDTEYFDGDVIVPSCDVVLDNSKTLSYTGGGAASDPILATSGKRSEKEGNAWTTFKSEILRLAHTLRLKGWRRVYLESGADIEVERLSGALTNAVYVVSPPKSMPAPQDSDTAKPKRLPAKLLLRIYGPQVEHLIDREAELGILQRLARKKIGPRLLGTFRNGRFEEYFASTTLTAADLRVPETSKQIAKRMRELHDGIELLERERDEGPFVWRNWDKWVERCEQVISFLDSQVSSAGSAPATSKSESWKKRGLVCGVEWPVFRRMVETYRAWLNDKYGDVASLREQLVFAHNDVCIANFFPIALSDLCL